MRLFAIPTILVASLLVGCAWGSDEAVPGPEPLPAINPNDLHNVAVAAHRALSGLTTEEAEAVIAGLKNVEALVVKLQQQAALKSQKPPAIEPVHPIAPKPDTGSKDTKP